MYDLWRCYRHDFEARKGGNEEESPLEGRNLDGALWDGWKEGEGVHVVSPGFIRTPDLVQNTRHKNTKNPKRHCFGKDWVTIYHRVSRTLNIKYWYGPVIWVHHGTTKLTIGVLGSYGANSVVLAALDGWRRVQRLRLRSSSTSEALIDHKSSFTSGAWEPRDIIADYKDL
ncbi:hypothetical protein DENSPDRAFT_354213 [Dentipellis sp. KUC8613]|nr:hypothetical protein DENSPDRAFT_354213 [Dentipellis sp. KUC8613]